jgi:hypothetical protein
MDTGREDKKPWDKWFWQDFEADTGLRSSSLEAQGLWMRMLSIMARSSHKGYLLDGKSKMESKTLAKNIGESVELVDTLLSELKDHGVYSETHDGVIFNRRMARSGEISYLRSEAGKMGGRPRKQNKSKLKSKTKAPSASASASSSEYSKILLHWNEFAEANGLVKIVDIMRGSAREAAVRGRMAGPGFNFEGLLEMIGKSPFLLCKVPNKPFRATFDWVMKASNYQKIIEGNYLEVGPQGLFPAPADHLGALKEKR